MQPPIERLREKSRHMSEAALSAVVTYGCMALGFQNRRTDVPWDDNLPMGEFLHPPTIDDVCDRLTHLVSSQGLSDEFLIQSVLQFTISCHEAVADPGYANDLLDGQLRMLEALKVDLALPLSERRPPLSDESLKQMIDQMKEGMLRGPVFDQECLVVADEVQSFLAETFSAKFWSEWRSYKLSQRA